MLGDPDRRGLCPGRKDQVTRVRGRGHQDQRPARRRPLTAPSLTRRPRTSRHQAWLGLGTVGWGTAVPIGLVGEVATPLLSPGPRPVPPGPGPRHGFEKQRTNNLPHQAPGSWLGTVGAGDRGSLEPGSQGPGGPRGIPRGGGTCILYYLREILSQITVSAPPKSPPGTPQATQKDTGPWPQDQTRPIQLP